MHWKDHEEHVSVQCLSADITFDSLEEWGRNLMLRGEYPKGDDLVVTLVDMEFRLPDCGIFERGLRARLKETITKECDRTWGGDNRPVRKSNEWTQRQIVLIELLVEESWKNHSTGRMVAGDCIEIDQAFWDRLEDTSY